MSFEFVGEEGNAQLIQHIQHQTIVIEKFYDLFLKKVVLLALLILLLLLLLLVFLVDKIMHP